jgi:hypothetical protein
VYGDEGHGLAKRANRLDALPKACALLARYLALSHSGVVADLPEKALSFSGDQ